MTRPAAIYLRVSTAEQARSGLGLEAQASACSLYKDFAIPGIDAKTFEEHASATSLAARPILSGILQHADQYHALIVLRLDRLARNAAELLDVIKTLRHAHCQLHSVTERLDTESPSGRVLTTIIAAFAEYERDLISTRTRDALQIAKSRGTHLGRKPFGYTAPGMTPIPDRIALARKAYALHQAGVSTYQVAAITHIPHSTIRYIINNPIYNGKSPHERR